MEAAALKLAIDGILSANPFIAKLGWLFLGCLIGGIVLHVLRLERFKIVEEQNKLLSQQLQNKISNQGDAKADSQQTNKSRSDIGEIPDEALDSQSYGLRCPVCGQLLRKTGTSPTERVSYQDKKNNIRIAHPDTKVTLYCKKCDHSYDKFQSDLERDLK